MQTQDNNSNDIFKSWCEWASQRERRMEDTKLDDINIRTKEQNIQTLVRRVRHSIALLEKDCNQMALSNLKAALKEVAHFNKKEIEK
jgi:hypothetical protein